MLFGVLPYDWIGPINLALAALSILYMLKRTFFTRYREK